MEKIQNIISMREIQRNYKKIFDRVKKTKKPLFLGRHAKPSIVVLDIDSFEKLRQNSNKKKKMDWKKINSDFNKIAKRGRKDIKLSKFIINDRANR